ncbi:BOI-related E3 ubiquitin-protein ligase 2 [Hirschfeldia incana]|nr:BOI-related E3 ubiquitin-protein ligase 2 [Hirschfeldia incana]
MAVDAHHLLLSNPQLFSNRDLMMHNNNDNTATVEPTNGGYCTNGYGGVSLFSATDDSAPPLLNIYGGSSPADSFTYYADGADNLQTRKRSRDSRSDYYHHLAHQSNTVSPPSYVTPTPYSFLGQNIDLSSHFHQQQLDIDRFVSLHMERVKFEIQEKRKRQARTIAEAIEHGLAKRLRVKEEERERIGKINHALEERVKSLSIENQIWRDLAQSNEATANNLRTNLEQVLAQVKDLNGAGLDNAEDDDDDAQSCCGSSSGEETVRRTVEAKGRMCRNCGEGESCVLVLPCRHLCLCGVCGSSVHTCPICRSPKNASVHVNMSP